MTRRFAHLLILALSASLLCIAASAAPAFATPGDSIANAVDLTPSFGTTITSKLMTEPGPLPTGMYYYLSLIHI